MKGGNINMSNTAAVFHLAEAHMSLLLRVSARNMIERGSLAASRETGHQAYRHMHW